MVKDKPLIKLIQAKVVAYMLRAIEQEKEVNSEPYLDALQDILEGFAEVFETPKELPPPRAYDHWIPLTDPQLSVHSRPSSYPFY